MVRCCLDGCSNECRGMRVKDGRVIGYYCDKHMTYLVLKEDSLNNNGLYKGSRWFRIGEFEKGSRRGGCNCGEDSIPTRQKYQ